MLKFKKITSFILILTITAAVSLSVSAIQPASASGTKISTILDGKTMTLPSAPILEGNTVLFPVTAFSDAIGGTAKQNSKLRALTITTADKTIVLKTGALTATVNGIKIKLASAVKDVKGTIYIPYTFLKDGFGASVSFASNTINIAYFSDMKGTLKIGGSTTVQPIAQQAADNLMKLNKGLSITATYPGSGGGIKGTISGEFAIGLASRELQDSEKASSPDLIEYTIGKDGIAVIVNKSNPLNDLTKKQVYQIFRGQMLNWSDAGGSNAAVLLQTREPGSGTLTAFLELALQIYDKKAIIAATASPSTSTDLVRQAVMANPNAVGYISIGHINSDIKAVSIDGVAATVKNCMNKKYPYVRPLEVLTKGKAKGLAAKYINYLLSPDGQKMIKDESYIPLTK